MATTSSNSSESEILSRLLELNACRRRRALAARSEQVHDPSVAVRDEDFFTREFGADRRLASYASLAPGRANHHRLAPLGGEWRAGLTVAGERVEFGWGVVLGFPALRLHPGGQAEWRNTCACWSGGPGGIGPGQAEYVRVLVPLYDGPRLAAVANLYEAVPGP